MVGAASKPPSNRPTRNRPKRKRLTIESNDSSLPSGGIGDGGVINRFPLNERQRLAITHIKIHRRITNSDFQKLTGAPHRTAVRYLMGLVQLGVLEHQGAGRGAGYMLRPNRAIDAA